MKRRRKRSRFRRLFSGLVFLLVLAAGLWVAGFLVFLEQIPRAQTPQVSGPKADAIVVLTGGGGRLEMGLDLLERGEAAKLFVSGVDRGVDKTELLRNQQIDAATIDCCVAVGHSADDTFGNATETARWVVSEGYTSLYVVTANYHMPRSLVEFRTALPDVVLLPRVVHPSNVRLEDWWRWPGTIRLLTAEYTKYLATLARTLLIP